MTGLKHLLPTNQTAVCCLCCCVMKFNATCTPVPHSCKCIDGRNQDFRKLSEEVKASRSRPREHISASALSAHTRTQVRLTRLPLMYPLQ